MVSDNPVGLEGLVAQLSPRLGETCSFRIVSAPKGAWIVQLISQSLQAQPPLNGVIFYALIQPVTVSLLYSSFTAKLPKTSTFPDRSEQRSPVGFTTPSLRPSATAIA